MQPEERDAAYLWHMLEAARRLQEIVGGLSFAQYQSDWTTRAAVERGLEVVGEAARRVSKPFQQAHSEIPWGQIISQRNVIAHFYYDLKQELIWDSATVGVTDLIVKLESLVPTTPPDPEPGG